MDKQLFIARIAWSITSIGLSLLGGPRIIDWIAGIVMAAAWGMDLPKILLRRK